MFMYERNQTNIANQSIKNKYFKKQKSLIFLYTSSEQIEIKIINSMAYNSTIKH